MRKIFRLKYNSDKNLDALPSTSEILSKCRHTSFPALMYARIIRNMGLRPSVGPEKIDGLFVPPGRAYTLLTDHLITN